MSLYTRSTRQELEDDAALLSEARGHTWHPEDFFREQPAPETFHDCGGSGLSSPRDGGGCPRCGGAGVEGGYRALRGGA